MKTINDQGIENLLKHMHEEKIGISEGMKAILDHFWNKGNPQTMVEWRRILSESKEDVYERLSKKVNVPYSAAYHYMDYLNNVGLIKIQKGSRGPEGTEYAYSLTDRAKSMFEGAPA